MNAVAYSRHGDASVLTYYNQTYPRPVRRSKKQVLIRVHYSSLNPVDFKFCRNRLAAWLVPKPYIPGADLAGIVVEASEDSFYKVGDRVAALLSLVGSRWGAAADYVVVEERFVAHVGPTTDLKEAAVIPLVGLTTLQALEHVDLDSMVVNTSDSSGAELGNQETRSRRILIQAGAGGVGSFAISYAKHVLGMTVIATASHEKAKQLLMDLGCDQVIDYRTTQFEDASVIPECSIHVVLDPMSWAYEERTLNSNILVQGGHYLTIASSDWAWHGHERLVNPLKMIRNWIRSILTKGYKYTLVAVQPNGSQLQTIFNLLENQTIPVIVDRGYPLHEAQQAYEYLEQGHATGKVLLDHIQNKGK